MKPTAATFCFFATSLAWLATTTVSAADIPRTGPVRVSADHRHLERADGSAFFWLGDTAWELFHRLDAAETETYLTQRADQGFTVIQCVLLAELDGLRVPNRNGDLPLIGADPATPNEAYFKHVDAVVARANTLGLTLGLLPTWGDKFSLKKWGMGPEVFTPANARLYGQFVGARYANANVVWILGGDRGPEDAEDTAIIDAMAAGLRESIGDRQLMTYHPPGETSSSRWWHDRTWLNFNLFQSGHGQRDGQNFLRTRHDRELPPTKPVIDGEPCYEDHPVKWQPDEFGWFNDFDVRRAAWWSMLAGAAGHTYGHHAVWQMWQPGREPVGLVRTPWPEALDYPGAYQMGVMRRVFEGLPWSRLEPQSEAVHTGPTDPGAIVLAAYDAKKTFALAYSPHGENFALDLSAFDQTALTARWIDPRTGHAILLEPIAPDATPVRFDPPLDPARGNDWILLLEAVPTTHAGQFTAGATVTSSFSPISSPSAK